MATDSTRELGLYIAYGALMTMATVPIYVGSFASLKGLKRPDNASRAKKPDSPLEDSDEDESVTESLSSGDAWLFPVMGSAVLFSLYLVFKFLDKKYINYIMTAYFGVMGCLAVAQTGLMVARKVVPKVILKHVIKYKVTLSKATSSDKGTAKAYKRLSHINLTVVHGVLLFLSVLLTAYYSFTKNWIASNVFGLSFSINAIQLIALDSFKTGMILLSGLFFYDIFWVFGTEVMVSVAKNFDAPIKVIWPRDVIAYVLQDSEALKNFAMLGLGDIVIPGIFVALCLRFDRHMAWQRNPTGEFRSTRFSKPYFTACSIAYVAGLGTTMAVMHVFKAAQPALLYLSPACIVAPLVTAFARGELKELFSYSTEEKEEETDKKSSKKKSKKMSQKSSKENDSADDSSEEESAKTK